MSPTLPCARLSRVMQGAGGRAQQLEGVHGQPRQRLGLVLQHERTGFEMASCNSM
jgi:hypothetical protein